MKKRLSRYFMTIFLIQIILLSFCPLVYASELSLPAFAIVEENIPVYKTAESSIETLAPTFNFSSKSHFLMEISTNTVLYENNANERIYPASITKIMTLILIMDAIESNKIKYTDLVTCSQNAESMGGSQIYFETGEQLTIDEAIKCICIVSANDVCVAMAEHLAGTESNFVQLMNERAKGLGMNDTNFVNSHGLHDDNHYTTARDIAIMSKELTRHPHIFVYTSTWFDSIRGGTYELTNTNKLINTYDGCNGLKTGFTEQSLYNLSATATRDNMSLIAIVVGGSTISIRNDEITQLLNYGFATYQTQELASTDENIEGIVINKNVHKNVQIYYEKDTNVLLSKGEKIQPRVTIEYHNCSAPLTVNTPVGIATFYDEKNQEIAKCNIIVREDVPRSTFKDYFLKLISLYGIYGLKT